MDGWDFKQYVLGALFFRFISENFARYIEGGDESITYAELDDSIITDENSDEYSFDRALQTIGTHAHVLNST